MLPLSLPTVSPVSVKLVCLVELVLVRAVTHFVFNSTLHNEDMFLIRRYVEHDLDAVVTLWYRSWINAFPNLKHPQPFEEWKLRFQNDLAKRGSIWVAEAQGRIAGFIVVIEAKRILDQIFVDVNPQGMGIGTALLNKAKTICPSGLSLTTLRQNVQACKFYEKHDFVARRLGVNPINGQPNIEYIWNPKVEAKRNQKNVM